MSLHTFFWRDGTREVLDGDSAASALNRAGYGQGAICALDFYAKGDCDDYLWDTERRRWTSAVSSTNNAGAKL